MSRREKDQRRKKLAQDAPPVEADTEAAPVIADVAENADEAGEAVVGEAREASATPTEAEEVSAATYDAYLEETADGTTLALILDLPGCFASGASRQDALDNL